MITIFNTPFEDQSHRNGQPCHVMREIPEGEHVDNECLPMWEILFHDGNAIDAFGEEIGFFDIV